MRIYRSLGLHGEEHKGETHRADGISHHVLVWREYLFNSHVVRGLNLCRKVVVTMAKMVEKSTKQIMCRPLQQENVKAD